MRPIIGIVESIPSDYRLNYSNYVCYKDSSLIETSDIAFFKRSKTILDESKKALSIYINFFKCPELDDDNYSYIKYEVSSTVKLNYKNILLFWEFLNEIKKKREILKNKPDIYFSFGNKLWYTYIMGKQDEMLNFDVGVEIPIVENDFMYPGVYGDLPTIRKIEHLLKEYDVPNIKMDFMMRLDGRMGMSIGSYSKNFLDSLFETFKENENLKYIIFKNTYNYNGKDIPCMKDSKYLESLYEKQFA